MSLINQVLKDLDARHESDARGRLHREVRPLPVAGKGRGLRVMLAGVLVLVLLGAAWAAAVHFSWWLPAMPAASVASPPPAAPVPVAASPAPAVAAVEALPPVLPEPAAASELKISSMLERPPVTKAAEPPPVRGAAPRPENAAAASPVKPAVKPEPAITAAPGSIEKQVGAGKTAGEEPEHEYRRAQALVNGGRSQEAIDLLLDVLRRDGAHVAARQLLVRLLLEQRRLDEVHALLAEGLALKPAQTGWAMSLARLQVERGDLPGAARTLQTSLPHAQDNADYLGFAGHVQHRLGQQKAAIESYQRAVRLSPNEGRWWLGLGLALEADAHPGEAREAFLRARSTASLNADLTALVEQKLR